MTVTMQLPMRWVLLATAVPMMTACYPRGLKVPLPYTVRANGDLESLSCAQERLVELGFVFYGDRQNGRDLMGARNSRRSASQPTSGVRDLAHEIVRLELKDEGGREVLEVTLGVSRQPDPTALDADRAIDLWLEAPSRSSIGEVDEVARECQRPPFTRSSY